MLQQLIGLLYARAQANGSFISNSGYAKAAVSDCRDALRDKVIMLCELREIVFLLDQEKPLKEFLKAKIHTAVIDKNPLYNPLSLN